MDKSKCEGCEQDRYNHKGMCERPGIDAPVTSDECWHLKTAKLVMKKMVSISQVPPWKQKPIKVPSCYSVKGFVFVEKNRTY